VARLRTVLEVLWAASRPPQLALIAGVYALGSTVAIADGAPTDPVAFLGGIAAVLVVATSVHYANEYADHETDRLTDPTPFSGGSQALPRTGLSPTVPLRAGVVSLFAGLLLAGACLYQGHLAATAAVLLGTIAVLGWQYSVGPLRLAWNGLGEATNAALGGLFLPVYGYAVLSGTVGVRPLLAFVPFFALVFCNLLATTWPDRQADAEVGKATLATRLPPGQLRLGYAAGTILAGGSLVVLVLSGVVPVVVAAASVPSVPFVVWGYHRYTRHRGPFPTVAAMVSLAAGQLVGWAIVAGLTPV
jgi:1,4-dihydroxy-2-naphthoate octaprenyltransferase